MAKKSPVVPPKGSAKVGNKTNKTAKVVGKEAKGKSPVLSKAKPTVPAKAKASAPVKEKKISTLQAKPKPTDDSSSKAIEPATISVPKQKKSKMNVDLADSGTPVKAEKKAPKKTRAELAAEKLSTEGTIKWQEYKNKHSALKAPSYAMSGKYDAHTPLLHKVLGWGYILSNQNDRLEVIFEQGTKILISNYKTN